MSTASSLHQFASDMKKNDPKTKQAPLVGVRPENKLGSVKVTPTQRLASSNKKKSITKSKKAGLMFPVGRVHRFLRSRKDTNQRVGETASVYLTAVLEYLTVELLDIAKTRADNFKLKRITPTHLRQAIQNDTDWSLFNETPLMCGAQDLPLESSFIRYKKSERSKALKEKREKRAAEKKVAEANVAAADST